MNIYVALGTIVALAVSACVCVFKAYRKGLSDGLEIGSTKQLKETVAVKKKEKAIVDEIDADAIISQIDKMSKF